VKKKKMKKIVAILMAMILVMSVTIVLAGGAAITKEKQSEKVDQQIFENKELNVLSEEKFVTDEILVKFKHGVAKDKIDRINSKYGAFVRHTSPYTQSKRMGIPKGKTVAEMVKLYQAEDAVEYAEPNYIAYALMDPNDPLYKYQWHLDNAQYGGIGMKEAWDISTGSGVIIAVVDTGVAYENYGRRYKRAPDLAGTSFVQGYDFVNDDTHPNDDNSHGTHVTGTIAQTTNNELGVAGVAFNAKIMPVKVLDKSGSGYHSWIAEGIHYATDNGAHVISLSLGGSEDSETLKNAVKYAYENGVTVIAATGNDASNTISYPAAYDDYVIAVGATRYDETLAYYSNYGPSLDLVAPGGDLTIDQNGDGYNDGVLQNTFNPNTKNTRDFGYWFFQGTSMATPHVSGVAALLIANGNADADENGITSPDEVRFVLQETAEDKGDPGRDNIYGYGIVDACAALQWTAGPTCSSDADCDDGLYCNGVETCQAGVCQAGTPVDCSGLNDQCNVGVCDETSDSCVKEPANEGLACDDGLFCNVGETCQSGVCTGGTDRSCDDSNPCTTDSCDEANNNCINTPVADGTSCDDDLYCNGAETCQTGVCQAGTPVDCSANNIAGIATCNNVPDDSNLFTWDYREAFTSECVEPTVKCTTGDTTISHECSVDKCSAECDATHPCSDTECDHLDGCVGNDYYDYYDVANDCLGDCTCENNECGAPTIYENDPRCTEAVLCWSGSNEYLYRNRNQMRKFCKCAQGTYGYNSYSYTWGRKSVFEYMNSGDNENWEVTSRYSYLPVYSVTCTDGEVYLTNEDYYG
jgi:serine protease